MPGRHAVVPTRDVVAGERFGWYMTIGASSMDRRYGRLFRRVDVRCDCGTEKRILVRDLLVGDSKSCGCQAGKLSTASKLRHGHTRRRWVSREYAAWRSMLWRCGNTKNPVYRLYVDVRICDRWRESFENFLADMGPRPPRTSLDRIDGNGHYEPDNCRWASPKEQTENRRDFALLEMDGRTQTVGRWCRELGIKTADLFELTITGVPTADAIKRIVERLFAKERP